ncbi:MAG: PAS domain S-box protein [Thermodesulfobacteriota bacterium]
MSNPQSSERHHLLQLQHLPVGIVIHAPDTTILYANHEAARLLGLPAVQMSGMTAQSIVWSFVRDDGTSMPVSEYPITKVMATGQPVHDFTLGIARSSSNDITWVLVRAYPEFYAEGGLHQVVVTFMDISARMAAETRQRHLSNVLRTIRAVNQLISQEKNRVKLLMRICKILTENRGYQFAWIGLRDAGGEMRIAGSSGIDDSSADALNAQVKGGEQPNCWRLASTHQSPVVLRDSGLNCRYCHLACAHHDNSAALAGSIRHGDHAYGVLVVALPAKLADDPEEQSLFSEILEDIGFGLYSIEIEEERSRGSELLKASEERFRALVESSPDAIFIQTNGRFAFVNPATVALFGATDEKQLLGKPVLEQFHPEIRATAAERIRQLNTERQAASRLEERILRLDGTELDAEFSGVPFTYCGENGALVFGRDVTERKRAALETLVNAAKLEAALESMTDAVFISDINGRFINFNEAFATFHKFRNKEECAKTLAEFPAFLDVYTANGELAPLEQWAVPRALRGEVVTNAQYTLRRKDTGETWVGSYNFAPIRQKDGTIVGSVVVGRDITEQKRTEEALCESERRFSTIFHNSPTAIGMSLLHDGQLLDVNPAFVDLFGYSRNELVGHSSDELGLWRDKNQRAQIIKEVQEKKRLQNFELEARIKSGETRNLLASLELIELGKEPCLLGVLSDITERKQAEQALLFTNAILTTQQEAAIDGILVVDTNGNIVSCNQRFVEMWGIPQELLKPKIDNRILQHVSSQTADYQSFLISTQLLDEHQQEIRQDEVLLADGRVVEFYSAPMIGSDRHLYGRVWYFRDITSRRMEEAERTNLQLQLQQAQKMESVGRLAGGVAHDYNNMIGIIMGFSELALSRLGPDDPLREELNQIYAAAERSRDITRQLLAFARKEIIIPKVLDINASVDGTIKILRQLIGEDIKLTWQPGDAVWPVLIDPSQLDQILANLCINARDAIADVGNITIETGMVTFDKEYSATHVDVIPGDFVVLAVSDDGCGMDSSLVGKIFEPFFTTKGIGKGTGLGLATVYGIVKQNNGCINVYSEPGQGTTFKIYLPRHQGEDATEDDRKVSSTPPKGNGETVLVVEDESSILSLTKRILSSHNYKVLTAERPSEALRKAREHADEIDLLVTDVVMPEMNGRELTEQIKSFCPKVSCLYMSGYTADVIAHRGVLDKEINFIQKPFTPSTLATKVRAALDNGRSS